MENGKELEAWMNQWINIIESSEDTKEKWTTIPGVGSFKNLKIEQDILDNEINLNIKYDDKRGI
jgi:hypothetical protein